MLVTIAQQAVALILRIRIRGEQDAIHGKVVNHLVNVLIIIDRQIREYHLVALLLVRDEAQNPIVLRVLQPHHSRQRLLGSTVNQQPQHALLLLAFAKVELITGYHTQTER